MSSEAGAAWRRAAVYGSLWAAVEIVAGSFLHNLRVPFAGSLLSAVGVLLMTAGHRAFPERGLIWRAALVCALMKSVSPSAVILGPMVGILMEGVLLEAAVRATGGRALGYLVGGALAVSWSMAQRIVNALIAFGPNVVRLYVDAYTYASRSLGVASFGPFDLIATLVALEMAAGCAAAAIGLKASRAARTAVASPSAPPAAAPWFPGPPTAAQGEWSLRRLAVAAAALVLGLFGQGALPLWAGALYVGGFGAVVLHVYPRAVARVRRPSLWIELAIVMILSGLAFGGVRQGVAGLLGGAAEGAGMTLRAMMVLFGFTAISVELRNPSILSWVERRRLRGLSDALGVAFSTLPAFIGALSDQRHLWRRPSLFGAALLQLANGLVVSPAAQRLTGALIVLTGPTGSGKTTLTQSIVDCLRARGARVAGILAPGFLSDGRRTGFDIVDLASGERAPLARERQDTREAHARWSRFAFDAGGLALGNRALGEHARRADVVIVDEVGPFELSGGGWAPALDRLASFEGQVLFVVRESLVDAVKARWGSADTSVFRVPADPREIADRLTRSSASAPCR